MAKWFDAVALRPLFSRNAMRGEPRLAVHAARTVSATDCCAIASPDRMRF
jgi:hypothetical protein